MSRGRTQAPRGRIKRRFLAVLAANGGSVTATVDSLAGTLGCNRASVLSARRLLYASGLIDVAPCPPGSTRGNTYVLTADGTLVARRLARDPEGVSGQVTRRPLNAYLTAEQSAWLERRAAETGESKAGVLRAALDEYIERHG